MVSENLVPEIAMARRAPSRTSWTWRVRTTPSSRGPPSWW